MKGLEYLGKMLFIIPMAFFGFAHLSNAGSLTSLVPSWLPFPLVWVYVSGILLVLSAVAVVLGKKAKLALQLLGVLLLLFAVLVHLPEGLRGNGAEMINFFKGIALAGGATMVSSYVSN